MARGTIRDMKRAVAAGGGTAGAPARLLAQTSALALLARSIRFGHERLALIRLVMAVHAGADVPSDQWAYCETVARRSRQPELMASLLEARELQQARRPLPCEVH